LPSAARSQAAHCDRNDKASLPCGFPCSNTRIRISSINPTLLCARQPREHFSQKIWFIDSVGQIELKAYNLSEMNWLNCFAPVANAGCLWNQFSTAETWGLACRQPLFDNRCSRTADEALFLNCNVGSNRFLVSFDPLEANEATLQESERLAMRLKQNLPIRLNRR
jgi:hypothetical protein